MIVVATFDGKHEKYTIGQYGQYFYILHNNYPMDEEIFTTIEKATNYMIANYETY